MVVELKVEWQSCRMKTGIVVECQNERQNGSRNKSRIVAELQNGRMKSGMEVEWQNEKLKGSRILE